MTKTLNRTLAVLTLCTCCAVLLAPAAMADDHGVTFKNQTAATQYVLAVYGEGGSCSEMSEKVQLTLEAGEETTLESGDSNVCWCSSTFGKIADCSNSWNKVKAGKVQKIR